MSAANELQMKIFISLNGLWSRQCSMFASNSSKSIKHSIWQGIQ